jgi:hypothetical protein
MVGGIGAGTLVCFAHDNSVPGWLAAYREVSASALVE